MFIGPPKLVFIKTTEGGTQAALRPGAPKGQTILVAPAPSSDAATVTGPKTVTTPLPNLTPSPTVTSNPEDPGEDTPPPRILRRHAAERKYGKRQKTEPSMEDESKDAEESQADNASETSSNFFFHLTIANTFTE